ncbi:hypothetical protein NL676_037993 [Syzygium grande]|nr:hypothetical protein NL676_037993 [Syzygium grande]
MGKARYGTRSSPPLETWQYGDAPSSPWRSLFRSSVTAETDPSSFTAVRALPVLRTSCLELNGPMCFSKALGWCSSVIAGDVLDMV